MIQIKRIYDVPAADDGYRVLIDRLWPRGISKERAKLDEWAKEVAPSSELRRWFSHDAAKFTEFTDRYKEELAHNPAIAEFVKRVIAHDIVTLLFTAKDLNINHAIVLKQFLQNIDTNIKAS